MKTEIETGGPAFPLQNHGVQTLGLHVTGMTLRDYFAAKAMASELEGGVPADNFLYTARRAYKMADAMLEARK